jgi:hypothetical protein
MSGAHHGTPARRTRNDQPDQFTCPTTSVMSDVRLFPQSADEEIRATPRMVKIPDVPESSGLASPVIIRPGSRSAARNATLLR